MVNGVGKLLKKFCNFKIKVNILRTFTRIKLNTVLPLSNIYFLTSLASVLSCQKVSN